MACGTKQAGRIGHIGLVSEEHAGARKRARGAVRVPGSVAELTE